MTYHSRLALYLAHASLADAGERLTSDKLATATGLSGSQVRRDISQSVGSIGKRGVGYKPAVLVEHLSPLVEPQRDQIKQEARQAVVNALLVLSRMPDE